MPERSSFALCLPTGRLALASQEKVLELAERGGAVLDLEAEQGIRHAFEIDRGGVWLVLTEEQHQKLKK